MGTKTKPFVLGLWKFIIRSLTHSLHTQLINQGEITEATQSVLDSFLQSQWCDDESVVVVEGTGDGAADSTAESTEKMRNDYKRRRQSYRGKMTHLTKRSPTQLHRDLINMRMKMMVDEDGYTTAEEIERVTTKTTPQDIESEMRAKLSVPSHQQFTDPMDAFREMKHFFAEKEYLKRKAQRMRENE